MKKLELALRRSARARGLTKGTPRYQRYVNGTLSKVKQAKEKSNG